MSEWPSFMSSITIINLSCTHQEYQIVSYELHKYSFENQYRQKNLFE